jgi:putative chitinase
MNNMLLAHCTGATLENATPYAKPLTEIMARFEINTPERISTFLANVSHETAQLTAMQENLYYSSPDRLREVFPSLFVKARGGKYVAEQYARNPPALSLLRYAGYHGRGLLHLTWKENYAAAGAALGFDYVKSPQLVMEPWHACATAAWFWTSKNLNYYADTLDLYGVRLRINGPAALGLIETKRQRVLAAAAIRTYAA